MSESEQRWTRAAIGDLIALDYGRALADSARSGDGYPVYGSSGLVGHNSKALVDGPGIIVGRKGTVGAITWSRRSFWPIDTTYYVRWLDEKLVDRRWTYWFLSILPLKRLDSSTGVPGLNRNDAYTLSVQLPPIPEQRRIAEILDTADDAIRSTERLIAKLEQTKQGILCELLTRGINELGDIRNDNLPVSQANPIQQAEWEVGPAERFCEQITVGVVTSSTGSYVSSGVPFVRSQNVHPNNIVLDNMLYITEQFNRSQRKSILRTGDVVIVRTGYPGTAAVISPELDGANCFSLIICRPKPVLDSHFLSCYLNSPIGKALVARTHFGSAQHNFNISEMRRLPIPVPPLGEQRKILSVMSSTDARLASEVKTLQKLRLLKQGLMADLLRGQARVGASA